MAIISVVTGAASIIGMSIASELTTRGSIVVGIDNLPMNGQFAETINVDITGNEDVASAAALVASRYGHVDHLIHTAAVTARTPRIDVSADLVNIDLEVWRRIFDVNVTGALICVQRFIDLLRIAPDPKILLVGSIQGTVPTVGTGGYGVSKAALVGLTRQLAAELAGVEIAVNMLSLGPISDGDTPTTQNMEGPTPMGRFGGPDEVARAVAAILYDAFSYMTGAVVPLDGGEHLRPRRNPVRVLDDAGGLSGTIDGNK